MSNSTSPAGEQAQGQRSVADSAGRPAGRTTPVWLAPALCILALSVMAVGQARQAGNSETVILAAVGSTLLSSLLIFLLLRRWAQRTKGYIGLGIVLLMVATGVGSVFTGGPNGSWPQFLILGAAPLAAVAAAWCFRLRIAAPVPDVTRTVVGAQAGRPAGLQGPIDAMRHIAEVLVDLFPTLPSQWSAAWLEIRQIGAHRECVFNVETNNTQYSTHLPEHLASKLSDAWNSMRTNTNGVWFSARISLDPADSGSYQTAFNYTDEPIWLNPPGASDYLDELELNWSEIEVPAWFLDRMATADEELPDPESRDS